MKKFTFLKSAVFFVAGLCLAFTLRAQQIAVVSPANATTLYTDLNLALYEAQAGSSVYLSGGGFQLNDSIKITKKLTIMGIGHRPDNDNADGQTNISGNFHFEGGADYSALIGVYLSGDVRIGTAQTPTNNFLLRFCNVNSVQVYNSTCKSVLINQNYLRNNSNGGASPMMFSNNIMHSLQNVNGGIINYNVIRHNWYAWPCTQSLRDVHNTQITNNILREHGICYANNSLISNNVATGDIGTHTIIPSAWADVFEGPDNGVNPTSNFHLKEGAWKTGATDGGEVGIYGGGGFSDTGLPPGPRIVSKKVATQTDGDGKLQVEIEVSAE
jgi:hypothetical protein